MSAVHGRGFPIRPHLAKPIVGAPQAPAPIVTRAKIASSVQENARGYYRVSPAPHLAKALVRPYQPVLPPIVTRAKIVSAVQAVAAQFYRVTQKPRVAKPRVIPFVPPVPPIVTRAKIVSTAKQNAEFFHRRRFKPRLPQPIVGDYVPPPPQMQQTICYAPARVEEADDPRGTADPGADQPRSATETADDDLRKRVAHCREF